MPEVAEEAGKTGFFLSLLLFVLTGMHGCPLAIAGMFEMVDPDKNQETQVATEEKSDSPTPVEPSLLPLEPYDVSDAGELPWIPTLVPSLSDYDTDSEVSEEELTIPVHVSVSNEDLLPADGDFEDEEDEHPFEVVSTEPVDASFQFTSIPKVTQEVPSTKILSSLRFRSETLEDALSDEDFAFFQEEETGLQVVLPESLVPLEEVEHSNTNPQLQALTPSAFDMEAADEAPNPSLGLELNLESLDPELLAKAEATLEEAVLEEEKEKISVDNFGSAIELEETNTGIDVTELRRALVLKDSENTSPDELAVEEERLEHSFLEEEEDFSLEDSIDLEETYTGLDLSELEFSSIEQEVLTLNADSAVVAPEELLPEGETTNPEAPTSRESMEPDSNSDPLVLLHTDSTDQELLGAMEQDEPGFVSSPDLSGLPEDSKASYDLWPSSQILLDVDRDTFLPYEGLEKEPLGTADFERVPTSLLTMTSTSDFSSSHAELVQVRMRNASRQLDFYPIEPLKKLVEPDSSSDLLSTPREEEKPSPKPFILLQEEEEFMGQEASLSLDLLDSYDEEEPDEEGLDEEQRLTDLSPLPSSSGRKQEENEVFHEPIDISTSVPRKNYSADILDADFVSISMETSDEYQTVPTEYPPLETQSSDDSHLEFLEKVIRESEMRNPIVDSSDNFSNESFYMDDSLTLNESLDSIEADMSGEYVSTSNLNSMEAEIRFSGDSLDDQEAFVIKEELLPSQPLMPAEEPTAQDEELPTLNPAYAEVAASEEYLEPISIALDSEYQPSHIDENLSPSRVDELELPFVSKEHWSSIDPEAEESEATVVLTASQSIPAVQVVPTDLEEEEGLTLLTGPSLPMVPIVQADPSQQALPQVWTQWLANPSPGLPGSAPSEAWNPPLTGLENRPLNPAEQQVMSLLRALQQHTARAACFVIRGPMVLGLCGVGDQDIQKRVQEVFFPLRLPSLFSSVASVHSGYSGPLPRRALDRVIAGCLGPLPKKVMVYPILQQGKSVAFYYFDDVGSRLFPRKVEQILPLMNHAIQIDYASVQPPIWSTFSSHLP